MTSREFQAHEPCLWPAVSQNRMQVQQACCGDRQSHRVQTQLRLVAVLSTCIFSGRKQSPYCRLLEATRMRQTQAFLQRGGGRLAHLANSLFHTVDTSQQGALSLKVGAGRSRALWRLLMSVYVPGRDGLKG